MAYTKKVWNDYPDTTTPILASDMNNIEDGIETLDTAVSDLDTAVSTIEKTLNDGWSSANETWAYSSVDDPTGVITISGDKTTKYSVGMRIKFTNGGNVIYGIITAISYSSPNTTLTFLHEIDPTDSLALHLMANSTITANYYSNTKAPYGFPINPYKWSIIIKNTIQYSKNTPAAGVWYNMSSLLNISVPIGLWRLGYKAHIGSTAASVILISAIATLSTANNNESDVRFTTSNSGSSINSFNTEVISDIISLSTKTTYFFNMAAANVNVTEIYVAGSFTATTIKAECAYL